MSVLGPRPAGGALTFDRRTLLRTVSLAAAGIGAGTVLTGCGDDPAPSTGSGGNAIPEMKLKVGSADPPPPGQRSRMMEWWEAEVTRKTGGKITFQNFWAGALVAQGELLEALQNKVVDLGPYSASWATGKLPLWNFELAVPFRPNEPRLYNKVMHKLIDQVPAFTEEYARNGVRILNLTPMEEGYDLHTRAPVSTLADLRGKKIAAPGIWMPKFVSDAGGTAVTMPAPERYQGMQSGVIDGHILSLQWSSDFKLTEVAKYWLEVGLGNTAPGGIAVSEKLWSTLSPEVQKIFSDTAVEAEEHLFTLFQQDAATYRANAEKAGVKFSAMSEAEKTKWAQVMQDYPAMWAKEQESKGQPGWEVIETYVKLCADEGWNWVRKWGVR